MTDDLIARLRSMYSHRGDGIPTQYVNPDGPEAADEIAKLRAKLTETETAMDGGDFDQWPTHTFVGQLRMQSRGSLDPEYARFMAATATHMGILSGQCDAMKEIADRSRETVRPRPLDEWAEDYGDVLWHLMPIQEPPFSGTPHDSTWPYHEDDDPRLWWTPLPDCNEINRRWEALRAQEGSAGGEVS